MSHYLILTALGLGCFYIARTMWKEYKQDYSEWVKDRHK